MSADVFPGADSAASSPIEFSVNVHVRSWEDAAEDADLSLRFPGIMEDFCFLFVCRKAELNVYSGDLSVTKKTDSGTVF